MKSLSKKSYILLVILSLALCFFSIQYFINNSKIEGEIPISYVGVSYAFDVNDLKVFAGYADYIFVGLVEETLSTDHSSYLPRTYYSVRVLDNLKGELPVNETVKIRKEGGLTSKKDAYIIFEEDILPKENNIYIFTAMVGSKGELSISGKNSTVVLEQPKSLTKGNFTVNAIADSDFSTNEVYSSFAEAVENQVFIEKERFNLK